jgi:hypothetical protein
MIYQVSDLAGVRRREFLDEAKRSSASLRDTDGSVLVMLDARKIEALQEAGAAAAQVFAAEAVFARDDEPAPAQLGSLAWLAELDPDDRHEALAELRDAIALTYTTGNPAALRETVHAWTTTVEVMRDPMRRAIHTSSLGDDYVEITEPTQTTVSV